MFYFCVDRPREAGYRFASLADIVGKLNRATWRRFLPYELIFQNFEWAQLYPTTDLVRIIGAFQLTEELDPHLLVLGGPRRLTRIFGVAPFALLDDALGPFDLLDERPKMPYHDAANGDVPQFPDDGRVRINRMEPGS